MRLAIHTSTEVNICVLDHKLVLYFASEVICSVIKVLSEIVVIFGSCIWFPATLQEKWR